MKTGFLLIWNGTLIDGGNMPLASDFRGLVVVEVAIVGCITVVVWLFALLFIAFQVHVTRDENFWRKARWVTLIAAVIFAALVLWAIVD